MTTLARILVAVDASPLSEAAITAAARLAARTGAVLDALFVEDINVVRVAAHPYVHTVSPWATRREEIDEALIDRALRLQAVAAHRAVERIAEAAGGVHAGFAVRRGRVAAELITAATHADLVCLGWSGRAEPGSRPRLGSVARAVAGGAGRPVMVVRRSASAPVIEALLAQFGIGASIAPFSGDLVVVPPTHDIGETGAAGSIVLVR